MKATGIVRRIDELGRVVIPKEIRRTQRIRRGDPLEIFTTGDGEVIFKKYSPIGEMNAVAAQYTEVLSKSFALTALVADRDRILTVSGSGRQHQPADGKADRRPQAVPERGHCRKVHPALRRLAPSSAVCRTHHCGGRCDRRGGPADRRPHGHAGCCPAQGRECGSGISGKADGRVKNMPERFPYNKEGAFFVYDRIMNLLKHFSKGLDSTGKLAIMVLALRNKEC